jgi:predicted dehydrogenase
MDGYFRLVGGCFSRDSTENRATAETWGVDPSRVYGDASELIDSERGRDITVAVLTPVFSHAPITTALLQGRFDVISEKPLVADVLEAERIQSEVRRSTSRLLVTFNYTGYPMIRELRARVERGDFGTVRQMRLTMQQESYVRRDQTGGPILPQPWRREDREIPTVSLDLGMHVVHLQYFLVPQVPKTVSSRMSSFGQIGEVIDDVDIMYECDKGLFVHGWWSKAAAGHTNGLSVEVFGTEGSARWVQLDPEVLRLRSVNGVESLIHRGTLGNLLAGQSRFNRFKAGHPDGFIEAFANTYSDIAAEFSQPREVHKSLSPIGEFSVDQSLMLLKLLAGAVESARARRQVTLNT